MCNLFCDDEVYGLVQRIHKLSPTSKALWGKMNVAQMLAHCNVAYQIEFDKQYTEMSRFKKWLILIFVKRIATSKKPYTKNMGTSPDFIIVGERNFDLERMKLITYINETFLEGAEHFNGRESVTFGRLSVSEWNNLLFKHLDHHLKQFGV